MSFVIFLGMLAAIAFRFPSLVLHPRLWAEEGLLYFEYAYHHSVWEGLIAPQHGYYNLIDNVASVLAAKAVPLEWAPTVTTSLAFAIQAIPYALVLWTPGMPWTRTRDKALACVVILLAQPTDEIWLNTICSQFHTTLIACLILLIDHRDNPRIHVGRLVLVAICGLTGCVSTFLTPLYVWKALRVPSPAARAEAIVMSVCAVIECVIALSLYYGDSGLAARLAWPSPNALLTIVANKSVVMLLGGLQASRSVALLARSVIQSESILLQILYGLAVWSVLAAAIYLAFSHSGDFGRLMLATYLTIFLLSIATSQGLVKMVLMANTSGRYWYAPNVILLLGMLIGARPPPSPTRWQRFLCYARAAFLIVAFVVSAATFRGRSCCLRPSDPDWQSEVRAWRADPSRPLHVAPYPDGDWFFYLRK